MLCNERICISLATFFLNKEYLELVITVVCYALLERGLWGLVEFLKIYVF